MASTSNYGWVKPTVSADSNNWGAILNTALDDIDSDLAGSVPRGHIYGLTLSTAGSSSTFNVSAGECASSAALGNVVLMALGSAYAKTTAAWAVGSGNGSLDTGSIANNTWYHVHIIRRSDTGIVDVLISLSVGSPALPVGYTQARRIGSIRTDGTGQWIKFVQVGHEFFWDVPAGDVSVTNLGTTAVLYTLSVPIGIRVTAIFNAGVGTGTYAVLISSAEQSVQTFNVPSGNQSLNGIGTTSAGIGSFAIMTNSSAQIRAIAAGSGTPFYLATQGWRDLRGQPV